MKIVHVIESFSPGGAEMQVKDLCRLMSGHHHVELWALTGGVDYGFEKDMKAELTESGVRTEVLGKRPHGERIETILKLRKYLRDREPDLVHGHLEHVTFYLATASMGRQESIVQTVHSTNVERRRLQRYYLRYLLDKFVAVSSEVKTVLTQEIGIPGKKVRVINNGVDTKKFAVTGRQPRRPVEKILSVGRLEPEKNHGGLLRGFKMAKDKLVKRGESIPHLDIAGEGTLRDDLVELRNRLELVEDVSFLGIREDVPGLMAEHDMFVMSSIWEGFSVVLVEAMAAGLPTIATEVGIGAEIVRDNQNGLLVEPGDVNELGEAIYTLTVNPKKRETFSRAGVESASRFDITETCRNYLDLYKGIVGEKNN